MLKRIFMGTAAALLAAVLLFPQDAHGISAQKAILLDADSGRVIFEKQADSRSLIASTTKIMTALVICEQCNVLDRVKIPKEAVGIEGSSIYLKEGEVLTIQELLYGLMLHSGNDAATALAIYCGGTVEGFAQMMNDKARFLGLEDTHFANPHGLDSDQNYSTARDLAKLAAYAMENPIFAQTVSTKTVRIGERSLRNHNKLLWQVEGADGVKTGYTKAAGRLLVSSAVRDGRRLIAVTINDGNDWIDHNSLLNMGFADYSTSCIVKKGEILGRLSVAGGVMNWVQVRAMEDFSYALAKNDQPYIRLAPPDFVYAPVVQGQSAGYAYVMLGEKAVGKVNVCYDETVERYDPPRRRFWDKLLGR